MMDRPHGAFRLGQEWLFHVWAPRTQTLGVKLGERTLPMRASGDGHFDARASASVGDRYAFVFPDGRVRPDPASRRQPDGVHAPSALFDPGAHRWEHPAWKGHRQEELVFYELHVGTFTEEGTLDAAAARLGDLSALGITCVELMPLQPFPGERNWGYDGVYPYGVHEAYGGPAALQRFVDRAHAQELSVCLDVVFNHLGPEGNYLSEFAPYFTSRHRSPWGDGVNFDGKESRPARGYVIDCALQWVRDFRVDALRLDAVHAIPDDSPVHLVEELAAQVAAFARDTARRIHVIAESDTNERRLLEPRPQGWGLAAAWADDLHHALHAQLTGERTAFYADFGGQDALWRALSAGWVYQGQHSAYRGRAHGTSSSGLLPRQFVVCGQNHDQVGNRPRGERLSTLVPAQALAPVAGLVLLGSGLPLLFMGEEYGERRPFLYFTSHTDPELARAVSEGRRGEFIATGDDQVPDPQAPGTFLASKLSRQGSETLRTLYRQLLSVRRRHLESISAGWPQVVQQGPVFTLVRPRLLVRANLSPNAQPTLGPWGLEWVER